MQTNENESEIKICMFQVEEEEEEEEEEVVNDPLSSIYSWSLGRSIGQFKSAVNLTRKNKRAADLYN